VAKKWNRDTEKYEDYELPKGACAYCTDMDKKVPCASCGKKIKYGNAYTSSVIYGDTGIFGFAVCEKCKDLEDEYYKTKKKKGRG
jgi:hypothetical protein